jgi:hypothetical protein
MIDTELIAQELRDRGHKVEHVISIPNNAGVYEFVVDGETISLDAARALLEAEANKGVGARR